MQRPSEYGSSAGGYRLIEAQPQSLSLAKGGLDFSTTPDNLAEGKSPYAIDVRFDRGGVSPDNAFTTFSSASASAANKTILKLAPFEMEGGTKFLMRMRPTKWDRWNGTAWLELNGTLTGGATDRLYALNWGDYVVAANGVDRLKAWDGVDANSVADLSADAPIARYIVKIGNRILAAFIKVGATLFPHDLVWSTDGDITDYTTTANGAGTASLGPDGSGRTAGHITGLGTVEGGAVIYRQSALTMALLTGVGAAPFRFVGVDFAHGCLSPYSISSGGLRKGNYFLGDDYMPYFFDGQSQPVGIGLPIHSVLRSAVYDPVHVLGVVDTKRQEYWLGYPIDNTLLIKRAYVFSIKDWVESNALVWRHRDLGTGYSALDFGQVPTSSDPLVDSVLDTVDLVTRRVNDFANSSADDRVLAGNTAGQAYYQDLLVFLESGVWVSQALGDASRKRSIGKVRIKVSANAMSEVEVSISEDGQNFLYPKVYSVNPTGNISITLSEHFGVQVTDFQFQIRILSGDAIVSRIAYTANDRGRAA